MPQFVIKNRKKRRYTKKTQKVSTFTFSKTFLGMMPLIIMTVAFIATLVISVPFRNAFSHIQFAIQMPRLSSISFVGVITFIKTLILDCETITAVATQMFLTLSSNTARYSIIASSVIPIVAKTLINNALWLNSLSAFPVVLYIVQTIGVLLGATLIIITNTITIFTIWLSHGGALIVTDVLNFVVEIKEFIISFVISLLQTIITGVTVISQAVTNAATFTFYLLLTAASILGTWFVSLMINVTNTIISATILLFHLCFVILMTLWEWLNFATDSVIAFVTFLGRAIIHLIEIPFKVLYEFWLLIKPYVEIFEHHVKMSGSDLSNGFSSLEKMPALLNKPQ